MNNKDYSFNSLKKKNVLFMVLKVLYWMEKK